MELTTVILTLTFEENQLQRIYKEIKSLREERLTKNLPMKELVSFYQSIKQREGKFVVMLTRKGAQDISDEMIKFSPVLERNKTSYALLMNLFSTLYRALNDLPVSDEKGNLLT